MINFRGVKLTSHLAVGFDDDVILLLLRWVNEVESVVVAVHVRLHVGLKDHSLRLFALLTFRDLLFVTGASKSLRLLLQRLFVAQGKLLLILKIL